MNENILLRYKILGSDEWIYVPNFTYDNPLWTTTFDDDWDRFEFVDTFISIRFEHYHNIYGGENLCLTLFSKYAHDNNPIKVVEFNSFKRRLTRMWLDYTEIEHIILPEQCICDKIYMNQCLLKRLSINNTELRKCQYCDNIFLEGQFNGEFGGVLFKC